ncbi:MAG: type II toxin-antitoxin system RelE/ParE family toxin [Acidobacteria bacterium]|nr:MAG: type II toxin-antitoxin system RelE/ParE family toxin [Acidobacteriota bacterium]
MVVKFLAPAQAELVEAVAYYNSQRPGLGSQFAEEVKRTIERILQFPEAWPLISARTRRCRANKFPYGIIYQMRGNVVLIVAVMHLHREPQTWKSRLLENKK